MNKDIWGKYMKDAAAGGKMGVGFPAGDLHGPDEVSDSFFLTGLQWMHIPSKDRSHPVMITIFDCGSKEQAANHYNGKKAAAWKEWPDNFPDHGNDYINVDHCGIKTEGNSGFAIWTQDANETCYLVALTGGYAGVTSFEFAVDEGHPYPKGIWLAVNASASC